MTSASYSAVSDEPASSSHEVQQFLGRIANELRGQIDASPALAAPRLTSLRERLAEIAAELDWLGAGLEARD